MKDLWASGTSNLQGKHFTMEDCKLSPQPSTPIPIIAAGQSAKGMDFASQYADYNFAMGTGTNTPTAFAASNERLVEAATAAGRDVGSYVLFMVIAEETDEAAEKKWEYYKDGLDHEALTWLVAQSGKDVKADANATATKIALPEGAINMNMGNLIGSYSKVAGMLDEVAAVNGTKGIMLVFDDFIAGLDKFGKHIQPLMKSRQGRA